MSSSSTCLVQWKSYEKQASNYTNEINKYLELKQQVEGVIRYLSALLPKISSADVSFESALKIGGTSIFTNNFSDIETDVQNIISNYNNIIDEITNEINSLKVKRDDANSMAISWKNKYYSALENEKNNRWKRR